jgi:hypothetical protein
VLEKTQDAFSKRETTVDRAQAAAVAELVAVAGGKVTTEHAELRADGTWDNQKGESTLLPDVQKSKMTTVAGLETTVDTATQQVTTVPGDETSQTPGTHRTVIKTNNDAGGVDVREIVETGTKWSQTWTVPDAQGEYSVVEFANFTLAEIQTLVSALGGTTSNGFYPPGPPNKFGKYDGRISVRPVNGGESVYAYTTTGNTELIKRIVPRGDRIMKETYTITYDTARGYGVSLGRGNYVAKNPRTNWGSEFNDMGRNWYWFKAVTGVTLVTEDVTAAYDDGEEIDL